VRAALTVGGVLGTGTALVFGLAAVTATVFPNGATVGGSMNGGNGVVFQNVGGGPGWQKIVNSDGSVTIAGPGQAVPVPMPIPTDPPSPDDAGGG